SRASIEVVKAVSIPLRLVGLIGFRPSAATSCWASARQISPLPCVGVPLLASGGATCAARTGPPSFSRPASATRTNLRSVRVDALLGERQADQPPPVRGHEVDRVGSRHLRRDDEVALVLTVLVVDEDEHATIARLVDDLLDRHENRGVVVLAEEAFELA